MLQDRELLSKDEVLKSQLTLGTKRRSQRSNDDPQPLEHAPKASWSPQKKTIESNRTIKREGQVESLHLKHARATPR